MRDDDEEKKSVLSLDIFRGMDSRSSQHIFESLTAFSFHDEKVIYSQGDVPHSLFFLRKGIVDLCAFSPQGKELVISSIKPLSFFGHVGFLDGRVRESAAIARSSVEGFSIKRADFMLILEKIPYAGWISLVTSLCEDNRKLNALLQSNALLSPYAKVVEKLIELCEQASPFQQGHVISISQEKLGKMLDLTRESINKYLSLLEAGSLISKSRGFLSIPDLERLRLHKEKIVHDQD